MQYSIVNYKNIDLGNRIDAEYFQPNYLHIEEALYNKNAKPLNKFCQITGSAFYPAATHLYKAGDLPFIRCVDSIMHPVITNRQKITFENIPTKFANEHKNIKRLTSGDIIITKVGTPCYASIINGMNDVALSRTVLGLKSIEGINPYYLVVYLRSKYGFLQLYRERELTIQFQLTLDRVGNILVYKPERMIFEESIARCLINYDKHICESENNYKHAQDIVLDELDMNNFKDKHILTFVRNYSETKSKNRFDAEYYQPRYENIIKAVKSCPNGWEKLENIVNVKKGIEVGSSNYTGKGVPFIRVSNLSPFELTYEKFITENLYKENINHQPIQGEILFSKDATPGIAQYINEPPPKMIPSSGILRLNKKTDIVNNEYLTLVLNSIIIKEQVKRDAGGSVILHWRPDQVKEALIPVLSTKKQKEIKDKVNESLKLRNRANDLLESAKKAVEMAIEHNEQYALAWLNKQIGGFNASGL